MARLIFFFKQLAVPFKICTDFPKWIHSDDTNNNASYTKKHQGHIPCSFAYKTKFYELVTDLASQLLITEK